MYCQVPVSLLRGAYCGIIICRFGNMICMHGGGQSRKDGRCTAVSWVRVIHVGHLRNFAREAVAL